MRLRRRSCFELGLRGGRSLVGTLVLAAGLVWTPSAAHAEESTGVCQPGQVAGCLVESVDVFGAEAVDDDWLKERLSTRATHRILGGVLEGVPILAGIDRATVEYAYFDRFVLERDLQRVRRAYHARGFFDVHVAAGRAFRTKAGRVRVEIAVSEGVRTTLKSASLDLQDWRFGDETRDVTARVTDVKRTLVEGEGFDEEQVQLTVERIREALRDEGFPYGLAESSVDVNVPAKTANVRLSVTLGPRCRYGEIRFEGLGELPEGPLRDALGFVEGDVYSASAMQGAEFALYDFGVLSKVTILPVLAETPPPGQAVVPIIVRVTPVQLGEVRAGVGGEIGTRLEVHGIAGWMHRNVLGGLRRLSIEGRPGLVIHPIRIDNLFDGRAPTALLPEVAAMIAFRQPAFIEARTNAHVGFDFNLYRAQRDVDFVESENIVGYREYVGRTGLERNFFRSRLAIGQDFAYLLADPFSYNRDEAPEGYGRVEVPSLETSLAFDSVRIGKTGDTHDLVRRLRASLDVQFAGGFMGGDADDVRLKPELRGYVPLSKSVLLAVRGTMGLLFPRNYAGSLSDAASGALGDASTADIARDLQLLYFRGFFSGGPFGNRGYAYQAVGPQGVVLASEPGATPERYQLVSSGGLSMWELSAEVRFPLADQLGMVTFIDASDVMVQKATFRLTHPHISAGFGFRYGTPLGALRADLGVRVPCLQVIGALGQGCQSLPAQEDPVDLSLPSIRSEGAQPDILGLPIAISIALGEAF